MWHSDPSRADLANANLLDSIACVRRAALAAQPKPDRTPGKCSSCVVVVSDPKSKQPIRYYLGRFRIDTAFINKTYAGLETIYSLDVKGGEDIVEYLDLGKSTVLHGHKSAQISLPRDIDQISKALALIASLCRNRKPAE